MLKVEEKLQRVWVNQGFFATLFHCCLNLFPVAAHVTINSKNSKIFYEKVRNSLQYCLIKKGNILEKMIVIISFII